MKVIKNRRLWISATAITGVIFGALVVGERVTNYFEPAINSMLNASTTEIIEDPNADHIDTEYYKSDYTYDQKGEQKLVQDGQDLYRSIVEEGTALLKNDNNALPLATTDKKITVYGNGAQAYFANLNGVLAKAGYTVDSAVWDAYAAKSPTARTTVNLPDWSTVPSSQGDVALVVLGRRAGEGTDCAHEQTTINTEFAGSQVQGSINKANETEFPNGDYLSLATTEDTMLKGVKALKDQGKFRKIVVIISTSNATAGDFLTNPEYGIDSALWVGQMSREYGTEGLVNILNGTVNPSGRIVDTIYTDNMLNPAMVNFGTFSAEFTDDITKADYDAVNVDAYTYSDNPQQSSWDRAVVYQEGIYVGYKYYETRYEDVVMETPKVGTFDYDSYVAYPFGHGLSYTTFEYSNMKLDDSDEDVYKISVDVKNTGKVAGKNSVLVYLQKPYTDYAKENHIEQAAVNLVGFGKTTDVVEPGETETVTMEVDKWQLRTYDAYGAGTYIFDSGDYYFTVAGDSHEATNNILAAKGYSVTEGDSNLTKKNTNNNLNTEIFSTNYASGAEVENQFDSVDLLRDEYAKKNNSDLKYLSRNDWTGTYPTETYTVTYNKDMLKQAMSITYVADPEEQANTEMPKYGQQNGLSVVKLKDTPWGDEQWWKLAEQMTYEETASLVMDCWYGSRAVPSVGKLQETDQDSSMGRVNPFSATGLVGTDFTSGDMRAATFNAKIMKDIGLIEGEQNLHSSTANVKSVGLYGFSPNIHRTPYGGRNGEYFSEDGFITGMACGYAIDGMREKGSNCYAKHYVLNDQEDHRHGITTWANEQTVREVYLQGFEYGITKFDGLGLMNSFNRVGMLWAGEDYGSQTGYLYNELGFKGAIVTDMFEVNHQDVIDGLLGETSMWLHTTLNPYSYGLLTSDKYRNDPVINRALVNAAVKMLYVASRTHTINGLSPNTVMISVTPWWKVAIISVESDFGVLFAGSLGMLIASYILSRKDKKSVENKAE